MSNSRGFTIIELVVVIVVLGILAITILPRFANKSEFNQRGAADKVLATLQFARKVAVAARHNVRVTVSGNSFVVDINTTDPDTSAAAAYSRIALPFQDRDCPGGTTGTACLPSDVALATALTTFVFDPAGRTNLSGTHTITFSGGSLSTTLTLVGETGYVY